ncbi:hypothetical protein EX30DRAFT_127308 [Ascodesmis nigricans]|uniref:Uncharacterized protein n=1 Tax=Ascodesmis nigricans TaxID=341454 RepID=A0A4S2MNU3_9PEZI|nr:hypothetical protein EX30DRAFT_127308 [Ascodesmis nigricans]
MRVPIGSTQPASQVSIQAVQFTMHEHDPRFLGILHVPSTVHYGLSRFLDRVETRRRFCTRYGVCAHERNLDGMRDVNG